MVIRGELNETGKVEQAIIGAGAVISLLGPKVKSKELIISNGYKNIITSMKKNQVTRLVTAVSSSYRDPKDKFQFLVSLGVVMLKTMAPDILKDIVTIGDLIRNSHLDWTMARLPMLKSRAAKGKVHIGYTGDGKFNFFELTRADLADFLLK